MGIKKKNSVLYITFEVKTQGPRSKFLRGGGAVFGSVIFVKLFFISFIFIFAKKWGAKALSPSLYAVLKQIWHLLLTMEILTSLELS